MPETLEERLRRSSFVRAAASSSASGRRSSRSQSSPTPASPMSGRTARRARRRARRLVDERAAAGRARALPGCAAAPAARDEEPKRGSGRCELRQGGRSAGRRCSTLSNTRCVCDRLSGGEPARHRARSPEAVGDRRQHELRPERRERNEDRAAFCLLGEETARARARSRLAGAARPEDREHTRVALETRSEMASKSSRSRPRKRVAGSGGRRFPACAAAESPRRRAVEAGRAVKVLEPVQAEVAQRMAVEEARPPSGRRRSGRRKQARQRAPAVDVDSHVALE